jgi:PEP-CTERM motif
MTSHTRRIQRLVLVLLVVLGAGMGVARADGIIDQSNTTALPSLFQSIQTFTPIGQSFTPTLTSLDFFDVYTEDFVLNNGMGATLEVEIFSGVLQTPLGTSLPTALPSNFAGPTDFTFATPVPLVPGDLFSAQVIVISGDNWGLGSGLGNTGGSASTYPGGDQILGGVLQPSNDLWFQEGTTTPEPSTLLLVGSALLGLLASQARKWLKTG